MTATISVVCRIASPLVGRKKRGKPWPTEPISFHPLLHNRTGNGSPWFGVGSRRRLAVTKAARIDIALSLLTPAAASVSSTMPPADSPSRAPSAVADGTASVAWCPVSLVPFPDGTTGLFPHIIERGKPGIIGVLADGRRYCNEGNGYYDYVAAMLRAVPSGQEVASWLICTHHFQRRYGLGIARPAPLPVGPYI